MNKIRAFLALDIYKKETLEKLQRELMSSAVANEWLQHKVKPIDKQNFHFTVIFLGHMDLTIINELSKKLSEIKFEPIEITYRGLGVFPSSNFARIIWVGVDERSKQEISNLAENITSKTISLGIRTDKQFIPHITLFRNKMRGSNLHLGDILTKFENKIFGYDVIDKIQLKRSELTPSGPIYSNIFTVHAK